MKTNTSKTKMWLSTAVLIPIMALLFYNFAKHETVMLQPEISVEEDHNQQDKVTKKEIAAYNAWAKPYNDAFKRQQKNQSVTFPRVSLKEVERYKLLYNRMTDAQKKTAEPFPNFPPPPPPAPPVMKKTKSSKKASKQNK